DTASTQLYTLSLHDALPICAHVPLAFRLPHRARQQHRGHHSGPAAFSWDLGTTALRIRHLSHLHNLVPAFEELHCALVLFRGFTRFERPQVAAPAGLGILFSGIEPILA